MRLIAVVAIGVGIVICGGVWWYVYRDGVTAVSVPTERLSQTNAPAVPVVETTPGASIGDENLVEFMCTNNRTIQAVFTRDIIALTLKDGRQIELRQDMRSEGVRYLSGDGRFEFRGEGDVATLREDGVTTYENCTTK